MTINSSCNTNLQLTEQRIDDVENFYYLRIIVKKNVATMNIFTIDFATQGKLIVYSTNFQIKVFHNEMEYIEINTMQAFVNRCFRRILRIIC